MSEIKLIIPHPRPRLLSDPYHDHGPEHLALLLEKSDDEFNWQDFQCLLGPFVPSGTYEESVYFLPLAFDYILANEDEALDLVTSLVWFASEYSAQLESDDALDAVRAKLFQCLDFWISDFVVNHVDHIACRAKGWGLKYFDHVRNSELLMEALGDLIRFKTHADLTYSFFDDLASADFSAVKSAWFLELARAHASKDVFRPPKRREIKHYLENKHLIFRHAAIVRESLANYDPSATYWLDTFLLLGVSGGESM